MEKDWGFAALIEYGGKRILFDTGDNPDILANKSLPPEQRYYDRAPPSVMKFGSAWPRANFELIERRLKLPQASI
jgi:hypothetical protein